MTDALNMITRLRGEAVSFAAKARAAIVCAVAATSLVGCAEYLDRKDTIAFSAGNAVQTNIVTHVVDPWPATSRNKNFAVNGQRMQRAVENYRCGRIATSSGDGDGGGGESSPPSQGASQGGNGAC